MSDVLFDLLEKVHDEDSFVRFLAALGADWEDEQRKESESRSPPYVPGANGWENGTIGAFLDRAGVWAAVSKDGHWTYSVPANAWRRCADILWAGKNYE